MVQEAHAQNSIEYEVSLTGNASSGLFAPYFVSSLNHGKVTQKVSGYTDFSISRELDSDERFSFGFGIEGLAGASSKNDYMRWDDEIKEWTVNPQSPSNVWLQQLYAQLKYRSLFVSLGMKEHSAALMNPELGSGDFVESGNARPIPEVRFGFHDFVDIPLTGGWLQMQCQLAYGKMMDDKYIKNHFNYYNYHIAQNSWYNYKFFFFRTNPNQRFMATFGMQSGAFFGGNSEYYREGEIYKQLNFKANLKSFLNMVIPVLNDYEDFAQGSTLGSWDFYGQYMLNNGDEICGYFQWPFEDGSGIAKRNKFDGIWGLEYRSRTEGIIEGVVLEYIDFRDQSGPIHYAPGDFEQPTITTEATGNDDYYNNFYYNSFANYGMSIGTPFLLSPIYNLNGYPGFTANRANGFHIGMNGSLGNSFKYRLLFGYQRSVGTYELPFTEVRTNTSMMVEGTYAISRHLGIKAQLAYDKGQLRGNNVGGLLTISYKGKTASRNNNR